MARSAFWPGLEPLESRIVLHAGLAHAALAAKPAAADPGAATTQVLNTLGTTLSQYEALQVQLDALATKMQFQSRKGRTADANHAQSLVKKFLKQENKRYKPIVMLAPTVQNSAVFSAALQLEQGVHQAMLTVKQAVVPAFRLMINATFTATGASPTLFSRGNAPDLAISAGPARTAKSVEALPAATTPDPDAEDALIALGALFGGMYSALQNIAGLTDACGAYTASSHLKLYNRMLDVIQLFYISLQDSISQSLSDRFVMNFNNVVTAYNEAVVKVNFLRDSTQIHTH